MATFTKNGRTYTITETQDAPVTAAHLRSRGFDGVVYFAEAQPAGRQKKAFFGMFYRSAKTGQFHNAI